MTKKGSLQLSINAIVVLILAITMLGLGLSFMRSMFGKTTGQLDDLNEGITDQLIEDIRKSGAKLTFDKEDIKIERGDEDEIYFGVKNVLSSDPDNPDGKSFGIDVSCDDALGITGNDVPNHIDITAFPETRDLEEGEVDVQKMVVEATPESELTTYSCVINLVDPNEAQYAKKSFYITVE